MPDLDVPDDLLQKVWLWRDDQEQQAQNQQKRANYQIIEDSDSSSSSSSGSEEDDSDFDVRDDELKLKVQIIDNGRGIKPEDIQKLFKLFGKIDEQKDQPTINTEGIGLGLIICKKIVENSGG